MARGLENKEIVDRYFRELNGNLDFLLRFIPCIIPQTEEDREVLENGLKAFQMLKKFNDGCRMDMGLLDELYDIDAIVEKYPSIEELLNHRLNGDVDSVLGYYEETT